MDKKVKWEKPKLIEVLGKNTGADCSYGNFANPSCYSGRQPADGSCTAVGNQATTVCSTGSGPQN